MIMSWVSASQRSTDFSDYGAIKIFLGSSAKGVAPTKRRGFAGVITLIFGLGLCYASLPYIGAFVNVGKIVGVSEIDRTLGTASALAAQKQRQYKKVYMRAGQSLVADYSIPKHSTLELHIMRCANRPVLEVFKCTPIAEQTVAITQTGKGLRQFTVPVAGFYYFGDNYAKNSKSEAPYKLIWRRT